MSLFREFTREVRRGAPRRVKIALLCLGIPLIIAAIIVGFKAWDAWSNSGIDGSVMDKVPIPAMIAGDIQALDCIRAGEEACPQYNEAKDYLVRASAAEGVVYTPLAGQTNPGKAQDDGTIRLVLTSTMPADDWRAFAAAATLNGAANTTTVTNTTVTTTDRLSGTFKVPDPTGTVKTGTMTFSLAQSGLILDKIVFGK